MSDRIAKRTVTSVDVCVQECVVLSDATCVFASLVQCCMRDQVQKLVCCPYTAFKRFLLKLQVFVVVFLMF